MTYFPGRYFNVSNLKGFSFIFYTTILMSFQRVHLNIAIMTCIWGTHTACFRFTSPCRLSFKDVVRIKCSIVICLAVNISFQLLNFPLRLYYCMFASPLYHSDPTNRQQTLRACSVANVSHSMLRLPADVLSLALSLSIKIVRTD